MSASGFCAAPKQQGVALVIVLSLIVVLGAIAEGHVRNVHSEIKLAMLYTKTAKARALAEAGIQHAILKLLQHEQSNAWPVNGAVQHLQCNNQEVLVAIRDARGLVDLNNANASLLARLFSSTEADEARQQKLVNALLDWRDKDNFLHLNGAEDDDYRAAGLNWTAHDDAFSSIEELLYLLGMTPDTFSDIAPYVTVHSGQAALDLQYAPNALISLVTEQSEQDILNQANDAPRSLARRGTYHIYASAAGENNVFASTEAVVNISATAGQPYAILSRHEPARFNNWTGN